MSPHIPRARCSRWALLLLTIALQTPGAWGQLLLQEVEGSTPGDTFGLSVDNAGDVNGDGFDDVIVGRHIANIPGFTGEAYWISGLDGSVLQVLSGPSGHGNFGGCVRRAGDVNADGHQDFVVSSVAPIGIGTVFVVSGADFSFLHELNSTTAFDQFGRCVSGAGDVNGDGHDDIVVGIPDDESNGVDAGAARVFSGLDGSLLYSYVGTATANMGRDVCAAGDYDGDGFDDYVVGAHLDDRVVHGGGVAFVYSGATGAILDELRGDPVMSEGFGRHVKNPGDLTGDGVDDLLVSSSKSVYVVEGGTGIELYRVAQGPSMGFPGLPCSGVGDVDGDGLSDFVVGHPRRGGFFVWTGGAEVFSGSDGTLLYTLEGNDFDFLGSCVAGGGDVNGDGTPDVLVGSDPSHPVDPASIIPGFVRVYSGGPPPQTFDDVCNGDGGNQAGCTDCPCANNAAPGTVGGCLNAQGNSTRLHASGDPSTSLSSGATTDLRFAVTGATPNALCILRSGPIVPPTNPSNPCFGEFSGTRSTMFNGLRCIGQVRGFHGARIADSAGQVGFTTSPWGGEGAPPVGIAAREGFLPGFVRYFQCWYRDSATLSCMRTLNTSQAVTVVFQP